jgi:hypothetical protein
MNLALIAAAASAMLATHALAQIAIVDRESAGTNNFFVTSGTVSESSIASDSDTTNLTGAFSFYNSESIVVGSGTPGAQGTASAGGGHIMNDAVTLQAPSSLVVDAHRQSGSIARVVVGTGQSEIVQNSVTRVRFDVVGADVFYFVIGEFEPHPDAVASLTFTNISTPGALVNHTATASVNESGTLTAGETYEFEVRVDNEIVATTTGAPPISRVNAYTLRLTVLPMNCRADLDGSGVIDFADLNYMLNVFGSQDTLADIDGAGPVNFSDLNALLMDFGQACP